MVTTTTVEPQAVLRPHAEQEHRAELAALAAADDRPRPDGWRLSPWAVMTYLLGGEAGGTEITPKYVGSRRMVEVAVATLATDRALLLLGVPGTAKTWLSEHLAAAISGDSTLMVQGTAGTAEEAVRYGWNYARLIAEGPSRDAMVLSPVMRAMATGQIARVEELTRMPSDVQDALITILSEKTLPIPELGSELQAVRGFNVIATANDRDRGVNELSSALRRRFNTVVLPVPSSAEQEVEIVTRRVAQLGRSIGLPETSPGAEEIGAWSRSSASCARGSPRTAGPRSSRPAARCPRPRRSPWSPAAWPWRRTSATACSVPPTWPAASPARSSRIPCPTGWRGRSISKPSCASETTGASSTVRAVRWPDEGAGTTSRSE